MNKVLAIFNRFGHFERHYPMQRGIILAVAVALLLAGMYTVYYSEDVGQGLADNVIRLHVVANSDSEEDQALKRDVRDVVLNYMREQLQASRDISQTKILLENRIKDIEQVAGKEVTRQGKNYAVTSSLGSFPFPTKMYGDVTLPAGEYQALRIVIGKGEGANWWCVLFPPLCFVDASHGTVPDSVKQDLKNVLTDEEYRIITTADSDGDIPVKVKFKVVEFFQDSKVKFSGIVSRVFK